MKLWEKGITTEKIIEQFTVGNDRVLDLQLAKFDVQGSLAHARMLESVGLLSKEEAQGLEKEDRTVTPEATPESSPTCSPAPQRAFLAPLSDKAR